MTSPPKEAQRFGRSQTPESPRPVHLPEPANIPVLRNQMDPVFNDTATYNIPNVDQPFSFSDPAGIATDPKSDEHDAVQDFLRGAEAESIVSQDQTRQHINQAQQVDSLSSLPESSTSEQPSATSTIQVTADPTNQRSEVAHPALAEVTYQVKAQANGVHSSQHDNAQETVSQQPHHTDAGVDYQSLLDTISQSASTAPAVDAITAPTTAAATFDPGPSTSSLPSAPGLPPKPPVQEQPADYANYQKNEPSQAQIFLNPSESLSHAQTQPLSAISLQEYAYSGAQASLPRPYVSSGHTAETIPYSPITGDRPWTPKTQSIYDQFLEDERGYVTEGIWDKFPLGSRLFVGNLPSEKVTKRDLFHIFHRHGRLAQISIKQAYGFVQFLEAADCLKALEAQQGVEIRGRKIHLEISKPQKNTRNAGGSNAKNAGARRRSRSPVRRRSNDRLPARNSFTDFRDNRRRDDFRRTCSPSPPRNYRSRDEHRPGPGRHSPRSYTSPRSPAFPQFPPLPPKYDEDAALPLPRRALNEVPDVQLLILDQNVPQAFINWVENMFRSKGLKASTIWLSPRLPLQAVIKRQILEGVHGIVKLLQMNSVTQKLPLQVFDRSSGASNVKFNEYVDLDINIAADIILHAKRTQSSPVSPYPATPQGYNGVPPYQQQQFQPPHQQYPPHGQHQYLGQQPQPQQPQPYPYPHAQQQAHQPYPHQQPLTPSSLNSSAPNLQQLLANLRQPSDQQPTPPNPPLVQTPQGRQPDLGGLLTNIAAHQRNQNVQPYQQQGQPQHQHQPQQHMSPQGYNHSHTPTSAQPSNVQNIMEQLARYQR